MSLAEGRHQLPRLTQIGVEKSTSNAMYNDAFLPKFVSLDATGANRSREPTRGTTTTTDTTPHTASAAAGPQGGATVTPCTQQRDRHAVVHVAGAGPGDQYKVGQLDTPDFEAIRNMCHRDEINPKVDRSPEAFREHRVRCWPDWKDSLGTAGRDDLAPIYNAVKASRVPNCQGVRAPVPSGLNISAWCKYIDYDSDETELLDFVKYGFPLGYMGPISDSLDTQNHPSALQHPGHVDSFIDTEIDHGAIVGPFLATPFTPWAHISPIMTREKSDPTKRRIITDLTYPEETSINAYIFKNAALGETREHSLPTVNDFAGDLLNMGTGAYMFTVDVARAYKNFRLDPLDWPLACIRWKGGGLHRHCHAIWGALLFLKHAARSKLYSQSTWTGGH